MPAAKAAPSDSVDDSTTPPAATASVDGDPHSFLEDVLGDESLDWVRDRNAECVSALGDPSETESYRRILSILDSKEKIPSIRRIGDGMYYNFWRDEGHVGGIWRKTTMESYRTAEPEWSTVLDLDALPPPTDGTAKTWVWHGSTLLDDGPGGKWDRALISLSPGGTDADTTREFDLESEDFIDPSDGGFALPTASKTTIRYRSRDEVLIGTDFDGDGSSMTESGYPRVVKSWRRGTPLSDAVAVFEAEVTDIAGHQWAYRDRGGACHEFRMRSVSFYTSKYWYRPLTPEELTNTTADLVSAPFEPVPIPDDADISTFGSEAMITLRSDWSPPGGDGASHAAGSLLSVPMSEVMRDVWSDATVLFEPTPTRSLQSTTKTRDYVVLSVLEDVRTSLVVWRRDGPGVWSVLPSDEGGTVPVGEDAAVTNVNRDDSRDNSVFLWRDGYLRPDTLELVPDVGASLVGEPLKSKPAMFDAEGLRVEQNFCTSKDGTRVPYFVIGRGGMPLDGTNPTLLDAYGGFEVSMLPSYSAGAGAAWLEMGGVEVIANVRGGGEYGPRWHQAALKENRRRCYEDVEAVARDLIDRGITGPPRLACIGGSNGGLMVGNMLLRPASSRLFGAAVCQVPLLDMRSYSRLLAGASWMAEYGDPDREEEWSYLRGYSPYHVLRHDLLGMPEDGAPRGYEPAVDPDWRCPRVLFTTSTRDDRVHPCHARKMVRALLEEAKPAGKADTVHYWENIEGGHGGAADNKQRAYMWALTYSFLAKMLGLGADGPTAVCEGPAV